MLRPYALAHRSVRFTAHTPFSQVLAREMQPSSNSAAQQPPTNARSSRELDIRHGSVEIDDAALAPPSEQFTPLPSSSPRSSRAEVAITLESLPSSILSHIGLFAAGGFLSGSCQATLAAIPALHYNIDIAKSASSFGKDKDPTGAKARGHMGLLPTRGALATGRVVTRVSVTGCSRKRSNVSVCEAGGSSVVHLYVLMRARA